MSEDIDSTIKATKQVLVIRKDLKMRRGKEIAQGGHGYQSFVFRRLMKFPNIHSQNTFIVELSDEEIMWKDNSFAKIVVQVESEQELLDIYSKAKEAGLETHLITDSGRTEFNGIPTNTCICIGPHLIDRINPITGHLKLY